MVCTWVCCWTAKIIESLIFPTVIQQTTKADAAQKKKYVAALRAEQELEEHMGFAPNPILHRKRELFYFIPAEYNINGVTTDDEDSEYEEEDMFVSTQGSN